MSQTKKILDKLALQSQRVLQKIKGPKEPRESSNKEVEILLYQYSTQEPSKRFSEEKLEQIHLAFCTLNEEDMKIIKGRYWEAKSLEVIANECGHLGDHEWTRRRLPIILEKLAKQLF